MAGSLELTFGKQDYKILSANRWLNAANCIWPAKIVLVYIRKQTLGA